MISCKVNYGRQFDAECVYDLETREDGGLIMIGHTEFNDGFVTYYDNFDEFIDMLVGRGKYIRLWAHNGWGFDHLFLCRHLSGLGELDISNGVFEGGSIQMMVIKINDCTIVLADSFTIFQTSLAKTTEGFCTEYVKLKIDHSPEWLYDNDRDIFYEYLTNDVLGLAEALQNLKEELNDIFEGFGNLRNTVGSTAMHIFRLNLTKDIMTSSRKLDTFEREGYFGGLVDITGVGIFNDVSGIDVNSMYPSVMFREYFPRDYTGYWSFFYETDVLGLWRVKFDTSNVSDKIAWVYDCKTRKRSFRGEAILDNDTIDFINKLEGSVEVVKGYVYRQVSDEMFDYMDDLYKLKNDINIAKRTTAKYILNSTYGKFGQKHERTRIGTLSADELKQKILEGVAVHQYDFGNQQLYSWEEKSLSTNTFCVIATLVTLRARLKLFKTIHSLTRIGCKVLYFDTDSIHYTGISDIELEECVNVSKRMGDWSYVFKHCEAGYAGRKLYYYLEKDKDVVRAKGVSGFTMSDMRELILKGQKTGSYTSCTSPNRVLFRGVLPGIFNKYHRILNSNGER